MLSTEEKKYYDRHLKLEGFGEAAQLKLKEAKLLVIGAGGLGCPLLQYLVSAGVGFITIMDDDTVSEHNLHRQVLFGMEDLGKIKSIVAREKLKKQNPHITINSVAKKLEASNALHMVSFYDLIIDGSDNFTTRYLVNDACVITNKPFVSGSISTYSGQVSVFNYEDGPTYRCLYPEAPAEDEIPNCSVTGVLGVLPGIIGSIMANEAIKLITKTGNVLKGELLSFDISTNTFQKFKFNLQPENKNIKEIRQEEISCGTGNKISASELKELIKKGNTPQMIDIRECWEFEEHNIGGKNIPLPELKTRISEINLELTTVFICQHGSRSEMAVKLLNNVEQVKSLVGGIDSFR